MHWRRGASSNQARPLRPGSSPGWSASSGDSPARTDSESRRRGTFATRIAHLDAQHPEGAGDEPAVFPNFADCSDLISRLDRRASQGAPVSRVGCRVIREAIPLGNLVKGHHLHPLIRRGQRDDSWRVDIQLRDLPAHLERRGAADGLGGTLRKGGECSYRLRPARSEHKPAYPRGSSLHAWSFGAGSWLLARRQGSPIALPAHGGSIHPPGCLSGKVRPHGEACDRDPAIVWSTSGEALRGGRSFMLRA